LIQNLRIEGFKNFQKVELELGPWNLFIGANASGKSNLLEVLRIFQGIALGYRIDEIFDGKPKSARGDSWEGVRGGLANAGFFGQNTLSLEVDGFNIRISTAGSVVFAETKSGPGAFQLPLSNTVKFDPSPEILRQYSAAKEVRQIGERGEKLCCASQNHP